MTSRIGEPGSIQSQLELQTSITNKVSTQIYSRMDEAASPVKYEKGLDNSDEDYLSDMEESSRIKNVKEEHRFHRDIQEHTVESC